MRTQTICDLISFGAMLAESNKATDLTVIRAIDYIIQTTDDCDVRDIHRFVLALKSIIDTRHMMEP